jgi:hypothetical protein
MSEEAVESVIYNAILDTEVRKALFADLEKALAGFDLTETEKAQLKDLNSETLDAMSRTLDARVSKSAWPTKHMMPSQARLEGIQAQWNN